MRPPLVLGDENSPPLLLHVCCAPCAGGCVDRLLQARRPLTLYFSNSNLSSREEFERRLDSVEILIRKYPVELLVDPYDHDAWLRHISGTESEREHGARCPLCFAFSLGRTAEEAARRKMHFATTLTVSPHKSSPLIFSVGSRWAHFEPLDFKKQNGFLHSRMIARSCGFYLQDFCGCEFSWRERHSSGEVADAF